jgi:hypothetical protein
MRNFIYALTISVCTGLGLLYAPPSTAQAPSPDKPIIKVGLAHTPQQLKPFEGLYYRLKDDPDELIRIAARDSSLVVRQLWDWKETIMSPLTNLYFYNRARKYSLYFKKNPAGLVTGALILNKDLFEKVKN